MKTNRAHIYLIIVMLVVVGLACTRSIPGATPKATNTPGGGGGGETQPTSPTDVMNQIYVFATQTAMAMTPGAPQNATPVVVDTPAAPGGVPPAQPGGGSPTQAGVPIQPVQTTPQAPAGQPPAMVVPASYTLQKNEFPFCIARRFNVDPGELLRMNGLSTYSVYYAGMPLRIPQTGRTFPGNRALLPHPTTYKVGPNDTIYSIACVYGDVDPMGIAYVNGLQAPYRLSAGQTLQIP